VIFAKKRYKVLRDSDIFCNFAAEMIFIVRVDTKNELNTYTP